MKKLIQIAAVLLILFAYAAYPQNILHDRIVLLSEYIASEEFFNASSDADDLALTDSIFNKSLEICDGDISEALLTAAFTAIPYNRVPIHTPLLGIEFNVPLPSAKDSVFLKKNKQLPRNLFPDTPMDGYGDKDKLAHFFGSAFLSYSRVPFDFNKIIGIFVEEFERSFKVQSFADPRDLTANGSGIAFGRALNENGSIRPSHILMLNFLSYFTYGL